MVMVRALLRVGFHCRHIHCSLNRVSGQVAAFVTRIAIMVFLAGFAAPANAACRQALAIGLDISGSVDQAEYRLQLDGLAAALLNPDVRQALMAIPDVPVNLFIYEWAGTATQKTLLPWTSIDSDETLQGVASGLRAAIREPGQVATALGQAMLFGAAALETQLNCWRRTIDLSGDGQSNIGPRPRDVQHLIAPDITINAIVIGSDGNQNPGAIDSEIGLLTSYFIARVIRGDSAFVEAALGFEDFENAMTRKLLKELQTLAIGALAPEHR